MAGITPNEGQTFISESIYRQEVLDLTIGLFVNSSGLSITSVWTDITQPTGGGYAEKALTALSFTVSAGGVATYAQQIWTATGGAISPDIYGYYVRTVEGSPRLVHFEFNSGARTLAEGSSYTVDLSTDTENG